jgi:hypothetical protein
MSLVRIALPHLVGLSHLVEIRLDRRIGTAGIFRSGRLMINPGWFVSLNTTREQAFVLAHELLHLALRSHERGTTGDHGQFNVAHDLIINDMLEHELGIRPPGGGIRHEGARRYSAEQLIAQGRLSEGEPFAPPRPSTTTLGRALTDALAGAGASDLLATKDDTSGEHDHADHRCGLTDLLENEWFPSEERRRVAARREAVERAIATVGALEELERSAEALAWGIEPSDPEAVVITPEGMYRPPWELALHRWLDAASAPQRTYRRASRRAGDRTDIAMPGRAREAWTLSIILDTSGSMWGEFERALGAIAAFAPGAGVEAVRIVQCDTDVTSDELVPIQDLESFTVEGLGGTVLDPAFERLAEDPAVTAALVLTDGCLEIPPEGPFDVLWAVTTDPKGSGFSPSYGSVVTITRGA